MTLIQNGSYSGVDDRLRRSDGSIALAILDLPIGSVINIDGTAIVLQRNDFIGIHSIPKKPATSTSHDQNVAKLANDTLIFHLVTIRGGNAKADTSTAPTTTVGFLMLACGVDDAVVARRYDPLTEQVSSHSIDEITIRNLIDKVYQNQIDPHRIVSYWDITSNTNQELWNDSTSFITNDFLTNFKKLKHGNKIVPGAYEFDSDNNDIDALQNGTTNSDVDGISVRYPPIPVFAKGSHGKNFPSNIKAVPAHRHVGTRRFLQSLSPSLRTSFFFMTDGTNPANTALTYIIKTSYEDRWEYLLGDLQMSFALFLHLHCYTSYTYWRDVVAMMSSVDEHGMAQHMNIYDAFFNILSTRIQCIDNENDAFSDIDLLHDDCFLPLSLERLLSTASIVTLKMNVDYFSTSLMKLKKAIQKKFPSRFGETEILSLANGSVVHGIQRDSDGMDTSVDFDDDDDVPVVVSTEEIEDSLTRSQEYSNELERYYHATKSTDLIQGPDRKVLQEHYPLLLAAVDSSSGKEDVLMTCARVLYDAVDASLVREAAAYLEDVESKKMVSEPF